MIKVYWLEMIQVSWNEMIKVYWLEMIKLYWRLDHPFCRICPASLWGVQPGEHAGHPPANQLSAGAGDQATGGTATASAPPPPWASTAQPPQPPTAGSTQHSSYLRWMDGDCCRIALFFLSFGWVGVWERERERERECVCVSVCECCHPLAFSYNSQLFNCFTCMFFAELSCAFTSVTPCWPRYVSRQTSFQADGTSKEAYPDAVLSYIKILFEDMSARVAGSAFLS